MCPCGDCFIYFPKIIRYPDVILSVSVSDFCGLKYIHAFKFSASQYVYVMRKSFIGILSAFLLLCILLCTAGCITTEEASEDDRPVAVCTNGIFVGTHEKDTGVVTFKGIPFAKQPVGDLRWKAPQAPDVSELMQEMLPKDASMFGHTAIQVQDQSEPASENPQGEDCLTLNIWTQDLEKPGKTVMVFFHGGGFALGGTSDPLYNGQYLAAKDEDIIIVTCNYRVGLMGFIDFSDVEGGKDFPDAPYLGFLDTIAALKWIQENIESFGGDPKKVTIFGESAGAGLSGCLLASEESEGLFQRAILESGDAAFTSTADDQKRMKRAAGLLKVTGAENMDDLMALSEKELQDSLMKDTGIPLEPAHPMKPNNGLENVEKELETYLAAKNTLPLRGNGLPIPENPYQALASGAAKDVDVLIGTNTDESKYFISAMSGDSDEEKMSKYSVFISEVVDGISKNSEEAKNIIDTFIKTSGILQDVYSEKYPGIWEKTEILGEFGFRLPAIKTAESHIAAGGNGKTYMYLFGHGNPEMPYLGAGHACELPYVFYNLKAFVSGGGSVDAVLADKISSMWINFAKTGNPSIDGFEWSEYTLDKRATMVVGNDSSISIVNDPKGKQRIALMPLIDELFPMQG